MLNYREKNQGKKDSKLFSDDIRKTIDCLYQLELKLLKNKI